MKLVWITGILFFTVFIILFWKLTSEPLKKEYGLKMWKQWTSRLYYWQAAIYTCTALTLLVIFLLKWVNVLTF